MSAQLPDTPEPPNGRITWSIYALALAASALISGAFAPFGLLPFLSGGAWFWIALAFGAVLAVIVNCIRPRYESTTGRWRAFYDFLLRQLPPPE
jgi:hypothetical protein